MSFVSFENQEVRFSFLSLPVKGNSVVKNSKRLQFVMINAMYDSDDAYSSPREDDETSPVRISPFKSAFTKPVSPLDDDFPEQILGEIFRYIPSDSLDSTSKTSTRWAKIVDRYTGRLLILKDGKDFIVDNESLFDKLSLKGNFWLSLACDNPLTLGHEADHYLTAETKSTVEEEEEKEKEVGAEVVKFPKIANPDSIRKIAFIGMFGIHSNKLLEHVFTSCQNLTGLYLHFSVFVSLYDCLKEDWNASGVLPCLKELVIDCCGTSKGDTDDHTFNYKHAYTALYVFVCRQTLNQVEKFIITVPYIERWEGNIVFAISGFLGRHSGTLKSFSFHQKYEISEDEYEEGDGKSQENGETGQEKATESGEGDAKGLSPIPPDLLPLEDVNYLSLKQLAENAKFLKNLSLEEFHVVLFRPQESGPLWKNLMIQQTGFKKLIFVGDKIPLPTMTIQVNAATLVTVRLDVRDVVDVECFEKCECLKHLTLRGKLDNYNDGDESEGRHDKRHGYTPPVQLRNAKSLPHTLESVEIINLRTDKEDAAFLAVILPYLRDLTLINLGWEGRLGLCLNHLALLWSNSRLDHFCIKASLNMMSYNELENDPRYAMNLLGCVIQSNSFASASRFCLEVWKSAKGHYTICRDDNYGLDEDDIDVFQIPNRNKTLLNEEEEEEDESESEESESESGSESDASGEESGEEEEDEWEDCEDGTKIQDSTTGESGED